MRRDARMRIAAMSTLGAVSIGLLVVLTSCSGATRRPAATATPDPAPSAATTDAAEVEEYASNATVDLAEGGITITHDAIVTDDVRTDYAIALESLRQGRHEDGVTRMLELTERAPDLPAPFIALGIAYAETGELELAESVLREAIEIDPQHPAAHNELGLVLRRQGRFADSRASYETALAQFSDFHYAHRNLAILCDLYLGDAACALEHYEAYARLVPEDPEVGKWIVDLRNRRDREVNP